MRRRAYLTVVGSGAALLAGCSGGGSGGSTPTSSPPPTTAPQTTATETETTAPPTTEPTPTDTPTPSTPAPQPPQVLLVRLVSAFEAYGDVRDNAIDAVSQGDTALVGYRFRLWVAGGTAASTVEVEVYDDAGDRVAIRSKSGSQLIDASNEYTTWENAIGFDTADWSPGTYEATVAVRDDASGQVSAPQSYSFDVTG